MGYRHEEDAMVRALDRKHALKFSCRLVQLVAARIARCPALRLMLADYVANIVPGGEGSLLAGRSRASIDQNRARLVRAVIQVVRALASETADAAQRRALERLATIMTDTLHRCRRRAVTGSRNMTAKGEAGSRLDSIDDALAGWVGLMKERGITEVEFLAPLGFS